MRLWQRGYMGFSFRHQDQYNGYEFRIRLGQYTNLTQNAQVISVSYTSVSGTPLPVVGAPNCVAHTQTNPGACLVDNNYNTWLTSVTQYKQTNERTTRRDNNSRHRSSSIVAAVPSVSCLL